MPTTRVVEQTFTNGILVGEKKAVISDEQLADESEKAALSRVDTIIDGISSLADAKVFLKRLCKRLVRNGVLP